MGQIAKQQKVVITRTGTFWVDLDQANRISILRVEDPQGLLEIDDCQLMVRDIIGVLTPQQYSNYQHEKRGFWQCSWQKWHQKYDDCTCARDNYKPPAKKTVEISDEERERNRKKIAKLKEDFLHGKSKKSGTSEEGTAGQENQAGPVVHPKP